MKYLLLIIAMVVGSYCWGQKKDSVVIDFNNTYSAGLMGGVVYSPKQDTLKVLMLVCDTMGWPHPSVGSLIPGVQAYNEGRSVWWQFGYEVKQDYIIDGSTLWVGGRKLQDHVMYLDQNKKPLPKSIVVWMTKEIK